MISIICNSCNKEIDTNDYVHCNYCLAIAQEGARCARINLKKALKDLEIVNVEKTKLEENIKKLITEIALLKQTNTTLTAERDALKKPK